MSLDDSSRNIAKNKYLAIKLHRMFCSQGEDTCKFHKEMNHDFTHDWNGICHQTWLCLADDIIQYLEDIDKANKMPPDDLETKLFKINRFGLNTLMEDDNKLLKADSAYTVLRLLNIFMNTNTKGKDAIDAVNEMINKAKSDGLLNKEKDHQIEVQADIYHDENISNRVESITS